VGVALFKGPAVLLVRRGKPPNAGSWSLPGGRQEWGETAEHGARRELLEETGITAGPLTFTAHVDGIHRDVSGTVLFHYTILDFTGYWLAGDPVAGDDVTDAVWAPLDALGPYQLWSEAHRVIAAARRALSCASDAIATSGPG